MQINKCDASHNHNVRQKIYNHMNTFRKKTSVNIQHPFMIKMLSKVGIQGAYFNIIKAIYEEPTTNIILNGKKTKTFPLRSGT